MTEFTTIKSIMGLLSNINEVMSDSIDSDTMFQLLLIMVIIDFMTGVGRAYKERTWNSTVGLNGMIRHGIILIVSGVVYYFSRQMDAEKFAHAFTLAFIVEYLISISENWGLAGYRLPKRIEKLLEKLKDSEFDFITNQKDSNTLYKHDKNDEDRLKKMANKVLGADEDE